MKMKTMADIITTVTKDINEITKIKNDLNALLRENGIEGGPVFSTYPDKFRSLFRVLDGRTEESTWNLPADSVSIITSVPKPVIVRRENSNTFYLYCANPDANIYYTIESEHYHIGERLYTAHGLLTITEDSYITAYAKVREVKSDTSWWNVEHLAEDTPESPEFDRDGTTLTITCSTEDAIIWYRVGEVGEFSQYTEPLTNVPRTSNVYAYSSNLSHQSSEIVVDEAPEKIEKPHTPTISQDINEIIVTSDEDDVDLYWKKTTDINWTPYTEGDEITESGYYISMAIRDGVMSEWSTPVELTFYPTPAVPTYQQNVNTIALQCSTSGAVIYYSFDDGETWIEYKGPFEIDEDETMILKSVLGPVESDESEPISLTYIPKPATPSINCYANTVTITCSTSGATIYYRIRPHEYWTVYTEPFMIDSTVIVESIARIDVRESDIAAEQCFFSNKPVAPTIICNDNKVTLYSPENDVTLYYRKFGTTSWTHYTTPFTISSSSYYEAKARRSDVDSDITKTWCQYNSTPVVGERPDAPVITQYGNIVTIISPTEGATIYWTYPNTTSWNTYSGSFSINRTVTIVAKCSNEFGESEQVYKTCYYTSPSGLYRPIIYCEYNCVTIDIGSNNTGGKLFWKEQGTDIWYEYTAPFYITRTMTIYAVYILNNIQSPQAGPYTCTYINERTALASKYFTIKVYDPYKLGTRIRVSRPHTSNGLEDKWYDIQYKINTGSWISINKELSSTPHRLFYYIENLKDNDEVQFKASVPTWNEGAYFNYDQNWYYWFIYGFTVEGPSFDVFGNILSICDGYPSNNIISNPKQDDSFCYLFAGINNLRSAEGLILPGTKISAYASMFLDCSAKLPKYIDFDKAILTARGYRESYSREPTTAPGF